MSKRPPGLAAIVYYKIFTATLLFITSVTIFLTIKKYGELQHFAYSLTLTGKKGIISWIVAKVLDLNPRTLQFSEMLTAAYGVVTLIEAIGLWYEKQWARWLVIGVVVISIPPEIYELIKGLSWLKLFALIVNIVILIYLLRKFPSERNKNRSN